LPDESGPVCGKAIHVIVQLMTGQMAPAVVGCTKRIGHDKPPFKVNADKRHLFTVEQDVEQRRL
jgi:hypothetical protein